MDKIIKTVEQLAAEGLAYGVNVKNLTGNIALGFLPSSGVFESCDWVNGEKDATGKPIAPAKGVPNYTYLQLTTSGGGHIAVRALMAQCADTNSPDNIYLSTSGKSKDTYLHAEKVHKPEFTGDLLALGVSLVGKSFTTAEKTIDGFISKYVEGGAKTKEAVIVVPKSFFDVTIVG